MGSPEPSRQSLDVPPSLIYQSSCQYFSWPILEPQVNPFPSLSSQYQIEAASECQTGAQSRLLALPSFVCGFLKIPSAYTSHKVLHIRWLKAEGLTGMYINAEFQCKLGHVQHWCV